MISKRKIKNAKIDWVWEKKWFESIAQKLIQASQKRYLFNQIK